MNPPRRAQVVVIGGGPAGASAALELARHGVETLLLERSDGRGNPVGESLAPSANPLLHRLGLYDALAASGALPCHGNRSSWGGDGALADHDFLRDPFGHGWHLDRPAFNAALLDTVASAGVTLWLRSKAVSLEPTIRGWRIVVTTPSGSQTLTADLLIDATGRAAMVGRRQGVRRRVFDPLVAAVAFLPPGESSTCDATTLVEAAASGWWYTALLPDGKLAVAWFTDPDLLAHVGAWRAAAWWRLLEASGATWERVAGHGARRPETVRVMAAGSTLLRRVAGDRWIAAGDAAAAFDPLSSHGIGSALADGKKAATAVAAALGGDETAIPAYVDHVVANYARFLVVRRAYYAEERRWPAAPFWSRRQSDHGPRPLV